MVIEKPHFKGLIKLTIDRNRLFLSTVKHVVFVMSLLNLFPNKTYAQIEMRSARMVGLAGMLGTAPVDADALFANPAELGDPFKSAAMSTARYHLSWSPDSLMASGGELKSSGYTVQYHQPFFGVAFHKATQTARLTDTGNPFNHNFLASDLWNVRVGVCNNFGQDNAIGFTAIYQRFEYKQQDNSRKNYNYLAADAGIYHNSQTMRVGTYVQNVYAQKKQTPRFDDYGGVILLEREPRDLHVSLSLVRNNRGALLADVGGLLSEELAVNALDDPDTLAASWSKWKSHLVYSIGAETILTKGFVVRLGFKRGEMLSFIDYANQRLVYKMRSQYAGGVRLVWNHLLTDVAVNMQEKSNMFYDETLDTKKRVFTFILTFQYLF